MKRLPTTQVYPLNAVVVKLLDIGKVDILEICLPNDRD